MSRQVDKLIKLLEEMHGKKLDLENDVYYLFLEDGLFSLYIEEDTKTLKVEVDFLPPNNTFVYNSKQKLEDLLDI